MRKPLWERRYERRAARRYWHMTAAWRPCYRATRRSWCARCFWREVTGQNRRDLAAFLVRCDQIRESLPPRRVHKNAEGRWVFVD